MKEEALKLADEFDEMTDPFQSLAYAYKAQAMIRRLVEELDKQAEPIAWATEDLEEIMSPKIRQAHIDHPQSCTHKFFPIALYATPQTKPLSDDEILHIYNESYRNTLMGIDPLVFAREIEERHGIK